MVEVHPDGEGDMRDDILVMSHSERAQSRCGEDGVGFVADARLAEVVHTHFKSSIQQIYVEAEPKKDLIAFLLANNLDFPHPWQ